MAASGTPLAYKRLLLKLSGEALMGKGGYGIDIAVVDRLARDIAEAVAAGCEIAVVVGGGNIFRGLAGAAKGMDRATADYMGMLGDRDERARAAGRARECQNPGARHVRHPDADGVRELRPPQGLASHASGPRRRSSPPAPATRFSPPTPPRRCAPSRWAAMPWPRRRRSMASTLPIRRRSPTAKRFDRLTYADVLARDLKVMDGAAIALARDNGLPVIVFSIEEAGNLLKVLRGEARATVIEDRPEPTAQRVGIGAHCRPAQCELWPARDKRRSKERKHSHGRRL